MVLSFRCRRANHGEKYGIVPRRAKGANYRMQPEWNMTKMRNFSVQTPVGEDVAGIVQIACPTDTLSDVLEIARLRGEALFACAISFLFGVA